MSINQKASLDLFYASMGKPAAVFRQQVDSVFLPDLKKPFIRGGPTRSVRRKIIQEAVDALQCYGQLGKNTADAATKRSHFETSFRTVFKEGLPANSPSAGVQAVKMKLIAAKYNILLEKLCLLSYWEEVGVGTADPDENTSTDVREWQTHFLYHCDPVKVRPILQVLINRRARCPQ